MYHAISCNDLHIKAHAASQLLMPPATLLPSLVMQELKVIVVSTALAILAVIHTQLLVLLLPRPAAVRYTTSLDDASSPHCRYL